MVRQLRIAPRTGILLCVELREATARDEPALAEVYVASRQAAWRGQLDDAYLDALDPKEEGQHLLATLAPRTDGWRILVADEHGQIIGFVTFVSSHEMSVGHVGALFVSPGWFGSGIGTRLLSEAAAALRDDGCTEAFLWTLEEDPALLGFYHRRGWEPDGGRQSIELDRPRTVIRCTNRLRQT